MSLNSTSLNYTDLNAVSQMKSGSQANSPENLKRVAGQFESLFLNMMVKSMRDANQAFAEGNPLNTQQTRFYQDMYDNQMSVHLAEKQGVGLASVLMRQLSPNAEPAAVSPVSAKAEAGSAVVDQSALLSRRRLAISSRASAAVAQPAAAPATVAEADWQPLRGLRAAQRSQSSAETTATPAMAATGRQRFDSPAEFVSAMLPMAEKAAERLGVDPHYLVAQAALETGWGKSIIRRGDGSSSHNLFGIKAHGGWQGESSSVMTHEYRNGVKDTERASFRSYESFEQSFEDYVDFLQRNGRYQQALSRTENPDVFFRELQQAGYATDPQYARKVSQIAQKLLGDTRVASQADTAANAGRA